MWIFGFKSIRRNNNVKELICEVRNICGYEGLKVQSFWSLDTTLCTIWENICENKIVCNEKDKIEGYS